MKNNLLTLVITLTVGIILAGSILVPVINGIETKTVTMEGYDYRATSQLGDYTYTANSDGFFLNDEPIDYKAQSSDKYSVGIGSETACLTYRESASMWGGAVGSGPLLSTKTFDVNSDGSWTITATNDSTISSDSTNAIEAGIFAKNDGELAVYVYPSTIEELTVKEGTALKAFCNYSQFVIDDVTYVLSYSITIIDGEYTVDYAIGYTSTTTIDVSDNLTIQFANVSVDKHDGLTTYTNFNINVAVTGVTNMNRCCLATPYSYEVKDSPYSALYDAIPIIVIIGLVLTATSVIFLKRRE